MTGDDRGGREKGGRERGGRVSILPPSSQSKLVYQVNGRKKLGEKGRCLTDERYMRIFVVKEKKEGESKTKLRKEET